MSLLAPPIAFAIVLAVVQCSALLLKRLAARKSRPADGTGKAYACGEESPSTMIQPDYARVLPVAFFFTILHVVALVVATIPVGSMPETFIDLVFIFSAVVGLTVIFRG